MLKHYYKTDVLPLFLLKNVIYFNKMTNNINKQKKIFYLYYYFYIIANFRFYDNRLL